MNNYHIRDGYTHRPQPDYFTANAPDGKIWQPDVYRIAAAIAKQRKADTLVDIGCGQAHKIAPYMDEYRVFGFDIGVNIEYCKATYPNHEWVERDLQEKASLVSHILGTIIEDSIAICCDVIEHLPTPNELFVELANLSRYIPIVLTTPDRIRTYGHDHNGPPANPHHVREWSLKELLALMDAYNIPVQWAGYTRSNNVDTHHNTAFLLLGNHGIDMSTYPLEQCFPQAGDDRPDVSVLIAAYNAQDTLADAVKSALNQDGVNVEVCICNDASTDDTPKRISELTQEYASWVGDSYTCPIQSVYHETNQMQHEALNSAARMATGRYFIQLDADDQLAPGSLKALVEALDNAPKYVGFAYGATRFYGAQDGVYKPPSPFTRQHFWHGFTSLYAFLYRREAWDNGCRYRALMDIDGKPVTVQDWDMALQLTEHMRYSAVVLPDVDVLQYTMQENSLKNRKDAHKPDILAQFKQVWPQVVAQQI